MREYLLPEKGKFYKANLHCHSTCSDGRLSPEEVRKVYMDEGYSVVAYTDHDILLDRSYLCQENFLALNGYEMEVNSPGRDFSEVKTCHICLIAKKPDNLTPVCWHRSKYLFANAVKYRDAVRNDADEPDYEREYTGECINDIIKKGREKGFFVTYNHPVWSLEGYKEYSRYEGMNAMEIVNYSCLVEGYDDDNGHEYDEFLRMNRRIYAIAADDNHNAASMGSRLWDSCGGWTMIKAERLEYESVTDALEKGNFYASTGPEIRQLWYEDGTFHIECSPAEKITVITGSRNARCFAGPEHEDTVTECEYTHGNFDRYVRFVVTDKYGRKAYTNGYFVKEAR